MIGKVEGVRAHLECDGLMLSNKGYIWQFRSLTHRQAMPK